MLVGSLERGVKFKPQASRRIGSGLVRPPGTAMRIKVHFHLRCSTVWQVARGREVEKLIQEWMYKGGRFQEGGFAMAGVQVGLAM